MNIRLNELKHENPKMNITKTRAIAYFNDGTEKTSEFFYSDIYAKQWVEQFLYDDGYSHYKLDSAVFFEEVDVTKPNIPQPHPVTGGW